MAKTFKDSRKREAGMFGRVPFKSMPAEERKQERRANHERKQLLRRAALEELLAFPNAD